MLVLFFLLITISNIKAAENFSKLVPDILQKTEAVFSMDGKFSGSCGGEGVKLDNMTANFLTTLPPAENYIFFSLVEHLTNPKNEKHEFRFFKNRNFTGAPDYVLNEEGLSQRGELKCSWNSKYSEEDLFGVHLKNCPIAKDLFGYHSFGAPQSIIELCSVMNINNYSEKNGKYSFQVKIADNLYYIDTTNMEELHNGHKFFSKKVLKEIEYRMKSDLKFDVARAFIEIRSSKSFQDLFQCAVKKDFSCLDKARSKEFFEDIADAGYKPICNAGRSNNNEGPFCIESYKGYEDKILKVTYKYMIEVIDDIYNVRTEKYKAYKPDSPRKILFRTIDKPHTEMNGAGMFMDFSSGSLIFSSFTDGLSC